MAKSIYTHKLIEAPSTEIQLERIDVKQLQKDYDMGKRRFHRRDLCGSDLKNAELSLVELISSDLSHADLSSADLSGADLRKCCLNGALLVQAKLKIIVLKDASLVGVNLSQADLTGASLGNADLNEAKLIEAQLIRANLNSAYLTNANLSGANLSEADLLGVYLNGSILNYADLRNTNLQNAHLLDAIYNDETRFDEGFDPVSAGMHKQKITRIDEILDTINHINKIACQYLGNTMIVNYWQLAKPNVNWFEKFHIEPLVPITYSGDTSQPINARQQQWIQDWVTAFIQQCSKIILSFPQLIGQANIDLAIDILDI